MHILRGRNKIQLKTQRDSNNISIINSRYQRFFYKSNYKCVDTVPKLQFGQTLGNLFSNAGPLEKKIKYQWIPTSSA